MSIPFQPNAYFRAITYSGNGGAQLVGKGFGSNPSPTYDIGHSLRFNGTNQKLTKTFGVPTNNKVWTFSAWIKHSKVGAFQDIFNQTTSGTSRTYIGFNSSDQLTFDEYNGSQIALMSTSSVIRKVDTHFHLLLVVDTTNVTADLRTRVYVDNNLLPWTGSPTFYGINATPLINGSGLAHGIGQGAVSYLDGCLSDVYFIDGQALDPSYFGQYDPIYDQWVPKAYTGTYGNNGFKLSFEDGTSTTTLGNDSSGNNNNWTLNNFTRAAGVDECWVIDTPSNNFCTLSGLVVSGVVSKGGLNYAGPTALANCSSSMWMPSGKWYWEVTIGSINVVVGIGTSSATLANFVGADAFGWGYAASGLLYNASVGSSYGATFTTNDVIGVAFDSTKGTLTFYKNGVSQGIAYASLANLQYFPMIGDGSSGGSESASINFGQRPFTYSAPTGFSALSSKNIPVNTNDFQWDLTWIKDRTSANNHLLFDSVRGVGSYLSSNTTAIPIIDVNSLTKFERGGFSISNLAGLNTLGNKYVAWNWKAGNTTVANTQGTITSQVRANPISGFSIITYTGTGANATVGHGLPSAPKFVVVKNLTNGTLGYPVWCSGLAGTEYLALGGTGAKTTNAAMWNSIVPSSTLVSLGTDTGVNANTNSFIMYCWAEVPEFSKMGSYIGNGSADGPFIYTGFKPAFVIVKNISVGGANYDWFIADNERNTYNPMSNLVFANLSTAEGVLARFDFVSNGFKVRDSSANTNGSGNSIMYMAFAEAPDGLGNFYNGPTMGR